MRTIAGVLAALAFVCGSVRADDFTIRNATGDVFGPFRFKEGATLALDGAAYRIFSVTNTLEQRIRQKLQSIVIPEMAFSNTPLREVVDFLRDAGKKHDPAGEGVSISLSTSSAGFANNVPQNLISNVTGFVTFQARRVTLLEAITIAAYTSGFRIVFEPDGLLVIHRDAPDGPMCRRTYDVLAPFIVQLREMGSAQNTGASDPARAERMNDLEAAFRGFGIEWPTGSSIQYIPQQNKLLVTNTERNGVSGVIQHPSLDSSLPSATVRRPFDQHIPVRQARRIRRGRRWLAASPLPRGGLRGPDRRSG